MTYVFNFSKSILYFLQSLIIITIISLVIVFFFPEYFKKGYSILFCLLLLFELPNLILYFTYLSNDYKAKLEFSRLTDVFTYIKKSKTIIHSFKDITSIELIVPPGRAERDSISIYPQDGYFYYKFYFNNGGHIIITSLLLNGKLINHTNFEGIEITKKIAFFPFL